MRQPIFIHNPKAASTSIRETLKAIRTPMDHTIHLPISHPMVRNQISGTTRGWVFMVVRHPIDRAVSAFYYWKRPRSRTTREFMVLEAVTEGISCSGFFETVNLSKLSEAVPHFRRQRWFQRGGKVDQILRFENLDEDFALLCRNLEMKSVPKLPRLRSTPHKRWEDELTPKAIKSIRDFYQPDFKLFYPEA